jgi:hypothetical protein
METPLKPTKTDAFVQADELEQSEYSYESKNSKNVNQQEERLDEIETPQKIL